MPRWVGLGGMAGHRYLWAGGWGVPRSTWGAMMGAGGTMMGGGGGGGSGRWGITGSLIIHIYK